MDIFTAKATHELLNIMKYFFNFFLLYRYVLFFTEYNLIHVILFVFTDAGQPKPRSPRAREAFLYRSSNCSLSEQMRTINYESIY